MGMSTRYAPGMSQKLNIGLVGAGKFGGYHAGKLAAHPSVEFAGVFDVSQTAAMALGERFNVPAFETFEQLLDQAESLVIASPATYHGDYSIAALEAGKNLLIEKPLATNLKQAKDIVRLSESKQLIVQVGHQERFVGRAIGLDKIPDRPLIIKAQRLNPYSERGTDTSVTMDLMTHDIDLVCWLMGEPAHSVRGHTRKVKSAAADHSWAQLDFDNGTAFLEASRLAQTGHRTLELSYPLGTVLIDLNAKTLTHNTPYKLNKRFGDAAEAKDSLAAGLNEFVSSIRAGRTPLISARDGLNAVEVATQIDKA